MYTFGSLKFLRYLFFGSRLSWRNKLIYVYWLLNPLVKLALLGSYLVQFITEPLIKQFTSPGNWCAIMMIVALNVTIACCVSKSENLWLTQWTCLNPKIAVKRWAENLSTLVNSFRIQNWKVLWFLRYIQAGIKVFFIKGALKWVVQIVGNKTKKDIIIKKKERVHRITNPLL